MIENGLYWIGSWGEKPDNKESLTTVFKEKVKDAPPLIRVCGQCFMPASEGCDDPPLISVKGRDIFFCGSNLTDYFKREFLTPSSQKPVTRCPRIPFWSDVIDHPFKPKPIESGVFYPVSDFREIGFMNYHCNGFHDFFLVGFDYRAGDFITENGSHAFGHAEDFVLTLRFAGWSIINHPTIELCFTGVRRFNVANGEYFMNEIFGAYTELRDDLDENKRQYVVWTDDWIDPNNLNSEIIMNNRSPTYTVANKMECRIIYI